MKRRRLHAPETRRNPTGDRDERGHFLPNNTVGRTGGRPRSRVEIDAAVRGELSLDEVRRVVRALFASAMAGDVTAARVLLDRLAGRVPLRIADDDDQDDGADGPEMFDDLAEYD